MKETKQPTGMSDTAPITIGFDRTPQDSAGRYYEYRLFDDFSAEVCEFLESHGTQPVNPLIYTEKFERGSIEAGVILRCVSMVGAIHRYQETK